VAHIEIRGHVQGAHRGHRRVFQDAGGHHALGAGIAHRRAFFGGLKNKTELTG
jgi:hypothetical protein